MQTEALQKITIQAGDDAVDSKWYNVAEILAGPPLFASHTAILTSAVRKLFQQDIVAIKGAEVPETVFDFGPVPAPVVGKRVSKASSKCDIV